MKDFELLEVVFGGCDTEDCACEEVEVEGEELLAKKKKKLEGEVEGVEIDVLPEADVL